MTIVIVVLTYLLIGTLFSDLISRFSRKYVKEEKAIGGTLEIALIILVWPYFLVQFLVGFFNGGNGPTICGGQ